MYFDLTDDILRYLSVCQAYTKSSIFVISKGLRSSCFKLNLVFVYVFFYFNISRVVRRACVSARVGWV